MVYRICGGLAMLFFGLAHFIGLDQLAVVVYVLFAIAGAALLAGL